MRKPEKEITSLSEIEDVIRRAKTCRVALCDNSLPYVIPVCYGYEDKALYFHCAPEGRKLDIIRTNNDVCFQMDTDVEFRESQTACSWSLKYRSVVGRGKAEVLKEKNGKLEALHVIMRHYSSQVYKMDEKKLNALTIVKITVYELIGKKSGW